MIFSLRGLNTIPGIENEICSFALSFPESEKEVEKKIRLTVSFDKNQIVTNIHATLVDEKEQ